MPRPVLAAYAVARTAEEIAHMESRGNAALVGGIALGSALTYLLDPDRGRRRRALMRDKFVSFAARSKDAAEITARNVKGEAKGLSSKMRGLIRREHDVPDDVLVERVRSKLGRAVSHPRAIYVEAREGHVALTGPVLARELPKLRAAVRSVPGVQAVMEELDVHAEPGEVPALQGGRQVSGPRAGFLQSNWSPVARLMGFIAGAVLLRCAAKSESPLLRYGSGAAALAVLTRAATNLDFARLTGIGAGPRAVDIQKTIHIGAPVEEVYELCRNFEQFPRFMSHLKEVQRIDDMRSHWVAQGPAGVSVHWDAVITREDPNHLIEWRSEPGSIVETAGRLRFEPFDSGTQLDVQMSYNPPAGALGHVFASLFRSDPKSAMNEDLLRLKSLLEQGKTRVRGEVFRREDARLQ